MMLTTGDASPLVIPFASTPPIEEDIANQPITPTVLNLRNGPCLVAYPMGTPDLEQVMSVALGIACEGAIVATEPMRVQYLELGKTIVQ
ncbi:hypothetical protein DSO57_1015651 [Entomophthora muscae]|uniref:Uncharacterized protein n=1 Tax=Entomophthora muscae TaxID=34485 RepID=A0ACC2TGC0_9FUNG|nr:hypothetical protein DSO57_1015651 [Entomophthora muscae]